MNIFQMLVVLLITAFAVQLYLGAGLGIELPYLNVVAGVATLKALALFLLPEKAPMVLVKSRKEIEEEN